MSKFSKFGAAALALALSVTILSPTHVFAAQNTSQSLYRNSDLGDSSSVITEDVKDYLSSGKITVTGATSQEARDAVKEVVLKKAVAEGFATTTEPKYEYGYSSTTIGMTTYYYSSSASIYAEADYDSSTKVYIGELTRAKFYRYTNSLRNITSITRIEALGRQSSDSADYNKFVSAIRVRKDYTTFLNVELLAGDDAIKVKMGKKDKKVLNASVVKKMGRTIASNEDGAEIQTMADGKYEVSYYNSAGEKIIVGTFDKYEDALAAKKDSVRGSYATRYIKLAPKKSGSASVTIEFYNGKKKSCSTKVKIYVVDDTDVFSTFTYGGKSLIEDASNPKYINYNLKRGQHSNLAAKKGKLVVKGNQNYQIKKIEVGTLYDEVVDDPTDYPENYDSYKYSYTTTNHKVDLNGDGDFDDTVNGVKETSVSYRYKTVKSGKKITLGTVTSKSEFNRTGSHTYKDYKNANGEKVTSSSSGKEMDGFYAPTIIRVTYFDKLNKEYGVSTRTLYVAKK